MYDTNIICFMEIHFYKLMFIHKLPQTINVSAVCDKATVTKVLVQIGIALG